ncbi:heparinase II/III family protein [Microvirga sp. 2MCAF38]|uniref:heparinase II/III domain-containing protein n=1 Tax=Microvirga sp. 2MCAF38 TaxID=3232989 RepID=UPI003F9BD24D
MPGVKHITPVSVHHAGDAVAGPVDGQHVISTKNRWSRVVLKFRDVTPDVWCDFSFRLNWHPDEEARNVPDFATVGVAFEAEDGSAIDFARVPGLTRAQIDHHCDYIGGPAYHDRQGEWTGTGRARVSFLVPSPAKTIVVTIRSWRNSHPFRIEQASLRQFVQNGSASFAPTKETLSPSQGELQAANLVPRNWRNLSVDPQRFHYGVVSGHRLFIRGQIVARSPHPDGALARIVYRDAHGEEIAPPYAETLATPAIGAFVNIPTNLLANRFTLELLPPPHAATVEVGFQAWSIDAGLELVTPLDVSLEDCLLLENISDEASPDGTRFLRDLGERFGFLPMGSSMQPDRLGALLDRGPIEVSFVIQEKLRAVQHGERRRFAASIIRLGPFPEWPLPPNPVWTEDPFHSLAWRLEFQSLDWLLDMARESPSALSRALKHAVSWSEENPWGSPKDGLSAHPLALARRAETFVELLAMGVVAKKSDRAMLLSLMSEIVRHGFALSEIASQNTFPQSIHQIHVAAALFAVTRALPHLPVSRYWETVALHHLREGFNELVGPDGAIAEPSPHYRLELLSLGLILTTTLKPIQEAADFRNDLLVRLKDSARALIALTDPTGMLPAFGDAPHGYQHAPWIRRLLSTYAREWLADDAIRSELAYPEGSRAIVFPHAGMVGARYFEQGRPWGHLSASLSAGRQAHSHFDCTSFVYAAGGVRWIVDGGGASHNEVGTTRQYLISARAHNVAFPDGREPSSGVAWLRSSFSFEGAEVFEIVTNVHGPDYTHRRIFVSIDNLNALAVLDHFTSAKPSLSIDGLLHFEQDVTVVITGAQTAMGIRGKKKMRVVPYVLGGRFAGFEIAHGRNDRPSSVQGFLSRHPGGLQPASALRYTFSGQSSLCGGTLLALDESSLKRLTEIIEGERLRELLSSSV